VRFSWVDFGEVWKCMSIGGMSEVELKSINSAKMKRPSLWK
jgi:hypothetical protein